MSGDNQKRAKDNCEPTERRRAYQPPQLTSYDTKTIIQAIGPAYGVYGAVPGMDTTL
ncbi:MAG TPA: hypothetical protein VD788_04940 [Candidatus Polarisedimenticolaceae bacterium]|nr:hypothetical protein [Candidatus Polarisedimenticolaceae bacterium]